MCQFRLYKEVFVVFFDTWNMIRTFKMVVLYLYRCHIRVIDTFGTEPAYNHEEYATLHGYRTNWGYWNLNARQYMTMFRKKKLFTDIDFICFPILCKIFHTPSAFLFFLFFLLVHILQIFEHSSVCIL